MDFKIAIASHKREDILESKTLKLLKDHKINFKKVYVFASPESIKNYKSLRDKYNFNLLLGGTILQARNNIIQFFDEGENIIEMDDDIENIEITIKGKKNKSVGNIITLFNESFKMIKDGGLFGFNANTNNFFADGKDKYGLYSIINSTLGYKNNKLIKLTVPEKEDFERVIKFYLLKLPILKRCGYGIKTKYWKTKGGLQACYNFEKRIEVQNESANILYSRYGWAVYKRIRKNGLIDLRFRRNAKI